MPKRPKSQVDTNTFYAHTVLLYTHLPPDHPHYALVGRVASEWSHFEHALDLIIWDLASFNVGGLGANVVACITSQIMGVGPRCRVIGALLANHQVHSKAVLKALNKLKNTHGYADDRARVIHDPWWIETGSKTPAQFRAMPASDPYYGYRDISKERIEEVVTDIRSLQHQAALLRESVHYELESLRKKLAG